MDKNIIQKFDISSEDKKQVRLNAKIYSQDINSAVFELSFSDKGVDIILDDTYEVTVLSLFRNSERKVFVDTKIEKGIAAFTFDNRLITDWDIVDSYVYLKKGDQTVDVNSFSFKVDISKIDQVVSDIKIYYIEDLEDVKAEYIKEIDGIKKDYQELLDAYIDELPSHDNLKGDAGTIEIVSVEVLDEDAKAEVINSGTESSAKLSFKIPRGKTGIQGEKGEGLKIDHTFSSIEEMNNADKMKFQDGDYIIINSDNDENGNMYEYVSSSETFIQKASIKGVKGDPGESIKGDPGASGLTAYEVAKKNGFNGTETEWLASLKAVWIQVTRSQYEQLRANGQLNPTTLYMVV